MNRRRADQVQRRIDAWERLRDELGGGSTHAVIGYITAELDRLRLEKLKYSRSVVGGRRADDPQPRDVGNIRAR